MGLAGRAYIDKTSTEYNIVIPSQFPHLLNQYILTFIGRCIFIMQRSLGNQN